jgi:hypothetical protein
MGTGPERRLVGSQVANVFHELVPVEHQQLTLLESEVGLSLIDRSQRRLGLTAAGQALARLAEKYQFNPRIDPVCIEFPAMRALTDHGSAGRWC